MVKLFLIYLKKRSLEFTFIGMSIVKIACFCLPDEEAMTFSPKMTELECTFKMEKSSKNVKNIK